jgi:ER membrane protein complex subunit 3
MLQRGIETADMDVTWVSSLSWYFLNLFGLRSIFTLILGNGNAANESMQAQMAMVPGMGAAAGGIPQPAEVAKVFKNEKEFLDLIHVDSALEGERVFMEGVEERLLLRYRFPLSGVAALPDLA